MRQRLSDLLRTKCNPPLERDFIAEVFRRCQRDHVPLGEGLLATGRVTAEGLRSALVDQVTEAVARIGSCEVEVTTATNLAHGEYDERFTFPPAEIFAALGTRKDPAGAAQ